MNKRPPNIRHFSELEEDRPGRYPGSSESLSRGAPLSRPLGLSRIGIHHETLEPGHRTSWPHAESTEEEFVYVLEGRPHVWMDGKNTPLGPGDAVAFTPGTGICHTIINFSDTPVRLLVVGERRGDNQVYYPHHPERREQVGSQWWDEWPERPMGTDPAR